MLLRSLVALTAVVGLVMACVSSGCSSSSSTGSPNKVPGQCVLSEGVWYCGTGYGNWPDCSSLQDGGLLPACDHYDGGACFTCSLGYVAGETCYCADVDGGPLTWSCIPSGTGCSVGN